MARSGMAVVVPPVMHEQQKDVHAAYPDRELVERTTCRQQERERRCEEVDVTQSRPSSKASVSASDFSRMGPSIPSEAVTKTIGDAGAGVDLGQFATTGGSQN